MVAQRKPEMHDPDPNKDPKGWIKRWIDREIEGVDSFKIPLLADKLTAIITADKAFLAAYLKVSLRESIVAHIRQHVAKTRDIVVLGDEVVDRTELTERGKRMAGSHGWFAWTEHVGDRHIVLPDMTREELLIAAGERRKVASKHNEIAELWERLAKQLRPEQKVADKFNAQQIAALAKKIKEER